jgi:hypothetical protein
LRFSTRRVRHEYGRARRRGDLLRLIATAPHVA